jgi:tryptophanyl-tRNA synthetase
MAFKEPNTTAAVNDLAASGIKRMIFFSAAISADGIHSQSDIPEHAEFHLLLSAYTPIGWLERNPTYKEQLQQLTSRDIHNYAFLGYPVLQTADIAIYKADLVPVGEDQLPHLELAREVVRRFNALLKRDVLVEPQAKLTQAARLLGLDRRKMSKSYGNQIDIADPPDLVRKKVMSMITDPKRIKFTDPGHPEECNVCEWYKIFSPGEYEDVADKCRHSKWGCTDCKKRLAEILVEYLAEPRARRAELEAHPQRVIETLEAGAAKARPVARATLDEVKELVGLGKL